MKQNNLTWDEKVNIEVKNAYLNPMPTDETIIQMKKDYLIPWDFLQNQKEKDREKKKREVLEKIKPYLY